MPKAVIFTLGGYWTEYSYTTFIGEIFNNLDTNIKFVKVTVNLWDASNNLIGSEYSYVEHEVLHTKAKTCISIMWQELPALAKITINSITYSATTDRLPSLALSNASLTQNGDYYKALGIIKNNDTVAARYVNSVNLIYNSSKLISCTSQYLGSFPDDLLPGASSSFSDDYISLPPGYSPTSYIFLPDAWGISMSAITESDVPPIFIDYEDEVVYPFE